MKTQLQFKTFEGRKEGFKYRIIQITDIKSHIGERRPTSIPKEIDRLFKTHQPGRIYRQEKTPLDPADRKAFVLELLKQDPKLVEYLKQQEQQGYKLLLEIPPNIPLYLGDDAIEFLDSKNGQRLLRGLAKENPPA